MKYSDFLLYVIPEVPGCPDFVAERAIRDAVIDFCIKTDVYLYGPEPLPVVTGVNEYDLDVPAGTEPNHIITIHREGRPLTKLTYHDAIMRVASGSRSAPSYYSQKDNTSIYIGPTPEENETLQILLSVKPTASSTSIPDTIGLENREAISAGTLYRLQMMAGQPWTNGGGAQTNKMLYDRAVAATMRQVRYGFSGASLTVKPREFI